MNVFMNTICTHIIYILQWRHLPSFEWEWMNEWIENIPLIRNFFFVKVGVEVAYKHTQKQREL